MTIRVPLRVVLFILYTAALLGGAAGVAFAVTQTAEGPRGEQGEPGPRGPSGPVGSSGADSTQCHGALTGFIMFVNDKFAGNIAGAVLEREAKDVLTRISTDC